MRFSPSYTLTDCNKAIPIWSSRKTPEVLVYLALYSPIVVIKLIKVKPYSSITEYFDLAHSIRELAVINYCRPLQAKLIHPPKFTFGTIDRVLPATWINIHYGII